MWQDIFVAALFDLNGSDLTGSDLNGFDLDYFDMNDFHHRLHPY